MLFLVSLITSEKVEVVSDLYISTSFKSQEYNELNSRRKLSHLGWEEKIHKNKTGRSCVVRGPKGRWSNRGKRVRGKDKEGGEEYKL